MTTETPEAALEEARAALSAGRLDLCERTARDLARTPVAESRAGALHLLAECALRRGDWRAAVSEARRALLDLPRDDAGEQALLTLRGAVLLVLADAHRSGGALAQAREALERALRHGLRLGDDAHLAAVLDRLGTACALAEDASGAAVALEQRRRLLARVGGAEARVECLLELGRHRIRLGEHIAARGVFSEALEIAQRADDGEAWTVRRVRALLGLVDTALEEESPTDARHLCGEAVAASRQLTDRALARSVERRWAELELLSGRAEAALAWVEHLAEVDEADWDAVERAILGALRARALLMLGRPTEAHLAALRAVEIATQANAPHAAARAEEIVGRALLQTGRHIEGAAAVRSARDAYERLRARADLTRVGRELGHLPLDAPAGGGADVGLASVLRAFSEATDATALLERVIERLVDLLDAERGAVLLIGADGEPEELVLHGIEWAGPPHPPPLPMGLVRDALRRGGPVTVHGDEVGGAAGVARSASMSALSIRSVMAVPFEVEGGQRGVLYADTRTRNVRGLERHLGSMCDIARLLANALENVGLREEWRFQNRLIGYLVHELRTPLSAFSSAAGILQTEGIDPAEFAEIGAELAAMVERMRHMIDDTLGLLRSAEIPEMSLPDAIDLGRVLRAMMGAYQMIGAAQEVEVSLDVAPDVPWLRTRRTRVEVAVNNLVFNALKFSPSGGEVSIVVRVRGDAGPVSAVVRPEAVRLFRHEAPLRPTATAAFVEVAVHNQGRAIEPTLVDHLFDPFVRGSTRAGGVRSTGLGLALVDACVRSVGGVVWTDPGLDAGACFRFTLPVEIAEP